MVMACVCVGTIRIAVSGTRGPLRTLRTTMSLLQDSFAKFYVTKINMLRDSDRILFVTPQGYISGLYFVAQT